METQKTTVIYINSGAPAGAIKAFFASEKGSVFWRDLLSAAAEFEPALNETADGVLEYLSAVYLPSDVAAPFIKRLEEIPEQNFVIVPWEGWQYPSPSSKVIQSYMTDQPCESWFWHFLGWHGFAKDKSRYLHGLTDGLPTEALDSTEEQL